MDMTKDLKLRQAEPYLNQMLKSIEELCDYVTKNTLPVKLGMENRAMCHQVPIFSEFEIIADRFDGSPAGIWLDHRPRNHDDGDGSSDPAAERPGRKRHRGHAHSRRRGRAGSPPALCLAASWSPFREYIQSSPIRVLELSGRLSAEETLTGTDRFVKEYGLSRKPVSFIYIKQKRMSRKKKH